jgi:hypothetical protein
MGQLDSNVQRPATMGPSAGNAAASSDPAAAT